MCSQHKDLYRESFKHFKNFTASKPQANKNSQNGNGSEKSRNKIGGLEDIEDNPDFIVLPYATNATSDGIENDSLVQRIPRLLQYDGDCRCHLYYGLRPPETWTVAEFSFPKGLIVIRNPFTASGQRYWISRTLLDFPHDLDFITNMDNLVRLEKMNRGEDVGKLSDYKLDTCSKDFYTKLRWVTFGYHHDWNTKQYTEERKAYFPEDLADMTKYISEILGFSEFKAEASIANYYHMDSTLSGHVDKSEVNQGAPLFSISFGQTAIFLIGGKTKFETPLPVLLRSGDIAVMSGESRLSYHGVPKIFPAGDQPWNDGEKEEISFRSKRPKFDNTAKMHSCHRCESSAKRKCEIKNEKWTKFINNYISMSRINLNIRQVLFAGQSHLPLETDCENKSD